MSFFKWLGELAVSGFIGYLLGGLFVTACAWFLMGHLAVLLLGL